MSEKRDSFVLYGNQIKQLETLSDEEAGKVIKNIYRYANGDTDFIELSPAAMMFFSFVQDQINRNREKYEEICRQRREAGKKGGAPKGNTNASKQPKQAKGCKNKQNNQKQAKQADTDTDTETDTEYINIYMHRNGAQASEDHTPEYEKVFAELWELYPRKENKGNVKPTQKKKIAKIGLEEMKRAIERYKRHIEVNRLERKYIKTGGTFFNSGYIDYLDENYQEENTAPANRQAFERDNMSLYADLQAEVNERGTL